MNTSTLLILFIKLAKQELFNYLKEPFYLLGDSLIYLKESVINFANFIIGFLYAVFLLAVYPLRIIQVCFYGIKNKNKWATKEVYEKHIGGAK